MKHVDSLIVPPSSNTHAVWATVTLAAIAAGALSWFAFNAHADVKSATARLEIHEARVGNRPAADARSASTRRSWTALARERDFSWGAVFRVIERAGSADIELLGFAPDKQSRVIQIAGEAKDRAALIKFIETIAAQPNLRDVHLLRQGPTRKKGHAGVAFSIKATLHT